jgi:protein-S-isoprenylcysteine O-methyltransferase Ste14
VQSTGVVPLWLARPLAVGGLVFFVDALLYFAYRYATAFGRSTNGTADMRAVVIDVTLFSVFARHHSVFARDTVRKRITRIVGVLERSTYVWIASALFIALCAWWQPVAGDAWHLDGTAVRWLLHAVQLVGVWLTLRSAAMIDVFELAGVRQVWNAPHPRDVLSAPEMAFTSSGPYGWVRHPIYLGWFLLVFAMPRMTMTRLVFATTSSIYLLIAIPLEERSLRRSSSGAYDRYMREVPWKLVPRLY